MIRNLFFGICLSLAFAVCAFAADSTPDLKYGLYIHYGLPTFKKAEDTGKMPATRFAPAGVNPNVWARTAKQAGMTFAVLTVKHESGFCLWDSADYDYDVGSSPFKGDIIGDFIAACQSEGILPGAHYSIPDANNEGAVRFNGPVPQLYFNFIKKQITELHTKYPGLRVQLFDTSPRLSPEQWNELVQVMHQVNPQCTIMDHVREGVVQHVSDTVVKGWFLRPNSELVPAAQLFQKYSQAQAANKAFLLNVGPGPSGNIPNSQIAVLTQMKELIARGPVAAPSAPGAATSGQAPAAERLKQVEQLYEQGLITKDDYDKKVKEITDAL